MCSRIGMSAILACLVVTLVSAQTVVGMVPCPVTVPKGQPASRPHLRSHGTNALSVELTTAGNRAIDPRLGDSGVLPDGALMLKYDMYRGIRGQIAIRGRRLDAPAAPLRAEVNEHYGVI